MGKVTLSHQCPKAQNLLVSYQIFFSLYWTYKFKKVNSFVHLCVWEPNILSCYGIPQDLKYLVSMVSNGPVGSSQVLPVNQVLSPKS